MSARALGVAVGVLADRVLGEPPAVVHPVARFGQAMGMLESWVWADGRAAGALYTAAGVAGSAFLSGRMARRHRFLGPAGTTFIAVAGRALASAAVAVRDDLAADDLDAARVDVRALVGRDPHRMDEKEVVRAVVESVAENCVDAVTAPIFWGLVGGAPAVAAYRAANTLDAMVGHHSRRYENFGWAAARLDDVANWLPARLTAVAVAVVRPRRAAAVWDAVRRQAPGHPSPNAGVVEAAFAAALGIRLGGVNDYAGRIEARPQLGTGPQPGPDHIDAAVRLSRHVADAWIIAALAVSALASPRARR